MAERTALLVCPETPYPMHGGGAIRTASVLHFLASRYAVDAVFFREEGQIDPRGQLPPGLVRQAVTLTLKKHSRTTVSRVGRNLSRLTRGVVPLCDRFGGRERAVQEWLGGRRYDLAVLEHFWVAPYLAAFRGAVRHLALDLHNVESVLLARVAEAAPPWQRWAIRRFSFLARRREQEMLPAFDSVWVASDSDACQAVIRSSARRILVYPNALPETPHPQVQTDGSIVFSGNWSYEPNQTGLAWFLTGPWPLIQQRNPGTRLRLIGRNPDAIRRMIARCDGIEIAGAVENAVDWIARSAVAIAPLLAGSGTRLKILEAWAAGVPVVATEMAAEGLTGRSGDDLLIENSGEGFASAVLACLASPELSSRLADAGRRRFESRYTWPAAWDILAGAGF